MLKMCELVTRVADTETTVLITGESGTGKELVAKALHTKSGRRDGPFVAINCAAMPESLLESELFGHVKGAFTDARTARPGLFIRASKGTLFLDEIGEMPAGMQAKLLRALQERTVRPVGGDTGAALRHAHPRGHEPRPRDRGRREALPRRPLLPHQRGARARAAAARARQRHPAPGAALPRAIRQRRAAAPSSG